MKGQKPRALYTLKKTIDFDVWCWFLPPVLKLYPDQITDSFPCPVLYFSLSYFVSEVQLYMQAQKTVVFGSLVSFTGWFSSQFIPKNASMRIDSSLGSATMRDAVFGLLLWISITALHTTPPTSSTCLSPSSFSLSPFSLTLSRRTRRCHGGPEDDESHAVWQVRRWSWRPQGTISPCAQLNWKSSLLLRCVNRWSWPTNSMANFPRSIDVYYTTFFL